MRKVMTTLAVLIAFLALPTAADAAGPELGASPAAVDFGTWNNVTDVGAMYFTVLKSDGDTDLNISQIEVTGADPDSFSISTNPGCEVVLAPGSSCQLNIYLDVNDPGNKHAQIEVTSDDPDSPLIIPLSAVVKVYSVSISPDGHDFGPVEIGSAAARPAKTFTVTSTGSEPFAVNPILTRNDAESFEIVADNCLSPLDPGLTCDVTVEFNPTGGVAGPLTTRLQLPSGLAGPSVALTGTAVEAPVPPIPKPAAISLKLKAPQKGEPGKSIHGENHHHQHRW